MGMIEDAAKSGDRLKALIELRDMLALKLDECESNRDTAALSRQFTQVLAEIDEIRGTSTKTTSIAEMREKLRAVN